MRPRPSHHLDAGLSHSSRTTGSYGGAGCSIETIARLRACVSIGRGREYEQDPRFGVIVLSEIASRALSPEVKDPGTAIEILNAGLRVYLAYADAVDEAEEAQFTNVRAPELDVADLFVSFFNSIPRDGASLIEVQHRAVVVLAALSQCSPRLFGEAASMQIRQIAGRSNEQLAAPHDREARAAHSIALRGS